jgi:hypothetical protein
MIYQAGSGKRINPQKGERRPDEEHVCEENRNQGHFVIGYLKIILGTVD